MTGHHDLFNELNQQLPLKEKLIITHNKLNIQFPFIVRVAVALYDTDTGMLKTYLHSSGDDQPLDNYQALLDEAPSLKHMLEEGKPRVINNLLTFESGKNEHTIRIGRQGYAASYTLPMYNQGKFFGFLFYNSNQKNVFSELVLQQLDVYAHLISLMVINELENIQVLSAAIKTTGMLSHLRDPETGSHLDRMSRYSRLIAKQLAEKYQLNDEYIEHIFKFSPLHDIGKIAIPDSILLKPASLTPSEKELMSTHSRKGREMIDDLLNNFGLDSIHYKDMLRNIAEYHHEAVNGSGYPDGKSGNEIPLEARIVAVADVFDALTSQRPYKPAWDNQQAIAHLKRLAGESLDIDCVQALIDNMPAVEEIQLRFKEASLG